MKTHAIIAAVAISLVLAACGGASYGSVGSGSSLYVSPSGSDGAPCTRASPCASFQRAYAEAPLGAVVYVEAGSYPAQFLTAVRNKSQAGVSSHVTIMPAPGAAPTVADMTLGSESSGENGPRHLTIRGIRDDGLASGCDWSIDPGSNDVTLDHVSACSIFIKGATNSIVENSDFYGCTATAPDVPCTNSWVFPSPTTNNIKILDNNFHDYRAPAATGVHFQCLFDGGGTNVTIAGNRFSDCEYFDIFLQYGDWCNCNPAGYDGLTIEDNSFARPYDGNGNLRNTEILFDAGDVSDLSGITISSNSFDGGTFEVENQSKVNGLTIAGNIIGGSDCIDGATYKGNLWENGQRCDASDRTRAPFGYRLDSGRLISAKEAHQVQHLFVACAKGGSAAVAAKQLTAAGDGSWSKARVRQLIGDPLYLGRAVGAPGADPAVIFASRFAKAQRGCLPSG